MSKTTYQAPPPLPAKLFVFWDPNTRKLVSNRQHWLCNNMPSIIDCCVHVIPIEIDTTAAARLAVVERERDHLLRILSVLNLQIDNIREDNGKPFPLAVLIESQLNQPEFMCIRLHPSHVERIRRIAGLPVAEPTKETK